MKSKSIKIWVTDFLINLSESKKIHEQNVFLFKLYICSKTSAKSVGKQIFSTKKLMIFLTDSVTYDQQYPFFYNFNQVSSNEISFEKPLNEKQRWWHYSTINLLFYHKGMYVSFWSRLSDEIYAMNHNLRHCYFLKYTFTSEKSHWKNSEL